MVSKYKEIKKMKKIQNDLKDIISSYKRKL